MDAQNPEHFFLSKPECLVDASGLRGMNGLVSSDRGATATHMSPRDKQGALHSIPEHRALELTQQQAIAARN